MNWIDLVILGAIGLALVTGYRRGVVLQIFSWGGFLIGIVIGGLVAPFVVDLIDAQGRVARAITAFAAFMGTAFVVEALVAFGGYRLARRITHNRVRAADAIAGSVAAALITLLMGWFLSVPAKEVPELSASAKGSAILRGTNAVLGTPPDLFSAIATLLNRTGFPEVFAQFNPSLAPQVEPAPRSLRRDREVRQAARLTYKIDGTGCGGRVSGSGFPVADDVLITAAHVVAGTTDTRVLPAEDAGGGGPFSARVIYMDTDTDIAVLRVPGLRPGTLGIQDDAAERGTDGAAIGYPGGGARKTSEARVRLRTDAVGRDIYGRGEVTRSIYVLRAEVVQGNSGGPFVDTDGFVRGMVFAASASDSEESYALTEAEIFRALDAAGDSNRAIDTGRCAV